MNPVTQSLKIRARIILDNIPAMPLSDRLSASATVSRMLARAAQIEGDTVAWGVHMRVASRQSFVCEKFVDSGRLAH